MTWECFVCGKAIDRDGGYMQEHIRDAEGRYIGFILTHPGCFLSNREYEEYLSNAKYEFYR